MGVRCRHLATGLEAFHLACDDPENLFAFAFRTPPPDDSGVAHILEHSVLCGSRRFPVKDPFVVLLKASLQTFLNAFTFPDKTVYPAASQLEKDFFNLLAVYGDAVFFPRLAPEVFRQEGHRLELAADGSLSRVGVVYNEMKGVVFQRRDHCRRPVPALPVSRRGPTAASPAACPPAFPRSPTRACAEFHRRFYHPSNCLLFLYGDIPTEKTLGFLQATFLEGFAAAPAAPGHPGASRAGAPRASPRPSTRWRREAKPTSKSSVTVNWLTVPVTDPLRLLGMEVLGEVLVGNPGSPLSRALLESGLGQDLSPCYRPGYGAGRAGLHGGPARLRRGAGDRGAGPDSAHPGGAGLGRDSRRSLSGPRCTGWSSATGRSCAGGVPSP